MKWAGLYRSQLKSPVVWMSFWHVVILLPLMTGWILGRETEKFVLLCPGCTWWVQHSVTITLSITQHSDSGSFKDSWTVQWMILFFSGNDSFQTQTYVKLIDLKRQLISLLIVPHILLFLCMYLNLAQNKANISIYFVIFFTSRIINFFLDHNSQFR